MQTWPSKYEEVQYLASMYWTWQTLAFQIGKNFQLKDCCCSSNMRVSNGDVCLSSLTPPTWVKYRLYENGHHWIFHDISSYVWWYSMIHHQSLYILQLCISWYFMIYHHISLWVQNVRGGFLLPFGSFWGVRWLFDVVPHQNMIQINRFPFFHKSNNITTKRGQKQKPSTSKFSDLQSSKMLF